MQGFTTDDYQRFFPSLIAEVARVRTDLKGHYQDRKNFCRFTRTSKCRDFYYSVAFRPDGSELEAELFITTGDRGTNLVHFDDLRQHRHELRQRFGAALNEDMYGSGRMKACRIGIRTGVTPVDSGSDFQHLFSWSIEMLAVLEDQFGPWIDGTYPPKERPAR